MRVLYDFLSLTANKKNRKIAAAVSLDSGKQTPQQRRSSFVLMVFGTSLLGAYQPRVDACHSGRTRSIIIFVITNFEQIPSSRMFVRSLMFRSAATGLRRCNSTYSSNGNDSHLFYTVCMSDQGLLRFPCQTHERNQSLHEGQFCHGACLSGILKPQVTNAHATLGKKQHSIDCI